MATTRLLTLFEQHPRQPGLLNRKKLDLLGDLASHGGVVVVGMQLEGESQAWSFAYQSTGTEALHEVELPEAHARRWYSFYSTHVSLDNIPPLYDCTAVIDFVTGAKDRVIPHCEREYRREAIYQTPLTLDPPYTLQAGRTYGLLSQHTTLIDPPIYGINSEQALFQPDIAMPLLAARVGVLMRHQNAAYLTELARIE